MMEVVHSSHGTDPSEDWRGTENRREMECYMERRPDKARGGTLDSGGIMQGWERFVQVASVAVRLRNRQHGRPGFGCQSSGC